MQRKHAHSLWPSLPAADVGCRLAAVLAGVGAAGRAAALQGRGRPRCPSCASAACVMLVWRMLRNAVAAVAQAVAAGAYNIWGAAGR
eukprot:1139407-Pelagomonas_calceolata.AAC.2